MPNDRRARVPGGTYFFTVVTYQRRSLFGTPDNQHLLGEVIRECQRDWPFVVDAIVLLPDHLHSLWTLPTGDQRFSARWSIIKKIFTRRFLTQQGQDRSVLPGQQRERRQGVWQPRFWEHAIRDDEDLARRFDYIQYNPVKHGLVRCPGDWAASSFHRWAKLGVYPADWACSSKSPPSFASDIPFGEPL